MENLNYEQLDEAIDTIIANNHLARRVYCDLETGEIWCNCEASLNTWEEYKNQAIENVWSVGNLTEYEDDDAEGLREELEIAVDEAIKNRKQIAELSA